MKNEIRATQQAQTSLRCVDPLESWEARKERGEAEAEEELDCP